jgi:hypothetical protein
MKNKISTMMLTLCLLGTTLLVISCRKGNEVVSEFPVDTTLAPGSTFNLDGIPFAYSVLSVDNRYLFTKKGDYYLAIVDNKFQPISELVRRGNGHEECLAPFVTGQYEHTVDKTNCYILERTTGSLYSLPLQEGSVRTLAVDASRYTKSSLRYLYKMNDTTYIGASDDGDCKTFTLNASTGEVQTFDHPDVIQHNKEEELDHEFLQTLATASMKQQKMAQVYFAFPILVIRNAQGEIERTVQLDAVMPEINEADVDDMHMYSLDVRSDDENIYLLYDDPQKDKECSILVFNWQGEPIARYRINRAIAFCVNAKHSTLVTLNEDDSNGLCSIYKLK